MKRVWPTTRLGDLTDLVTKGTTPTSIGHAFIPDGINFVKVESISTSGQFLEEKFAHISSECHSVLGRSQLKAGDILFSIAGALGRTAFVTDDILPANTNQALAIIRLKRQVGLLPQFLLKALGTGVVLEQIERFRGGVAQQNLSLAQVRDFQISLPPLLEQRRIVAILDEAFDGIATAKANTEKNLQNARDLFESHLHCVFAQRGKGWVEQRLGELCTFSSGGTPSKSNSSYWSGKIPWVSGRDMKSTRLSDSLLHISRTAVEESATRMAQVGTLLILVRGMGLAHGAQIAELMVPCAFNQDIRGIHTNADLLPRYLLFALREGINSSDTVLSNAAHGTLKIDSDDLQRVMIPYPPRNQQERIVAVIDGLAGETQRLASIYEQKLAALEELKKSLLHQAFTGAL
jgi:type I restriction enzyme S subunit